MEIFPSFSGCFNPSSSSGIIPNFQEFCFFQLLFPLLPGKIKILPNHGNYRTMGKKPQILEFLQFFPKENPPGFIWGSFSHPFPCINLFPNFFGPSQASGFALPGGKEDFLKKKSGGKIPNFCIFPLLQELGIVFYFSQAGS